MTTSTGRIAGRLAAALRDDIRAGRFLAGDYLPTERELAARHSLAVMTARRALRALQDEGLVRIEPRRGCRVLAAANDPLKGCPIAHVHGYPADEVLDNVSKHINTTVQESVARRGWSTLVVHVGNRAAQEVVEELCAARAWGVVLEAADAELLRLIKKIGVPVLMVNAWRENAEFDAVLQDNYQGGFLAASHLIERGHTEIGWFGSVGESNFSRERIGGALAALASAGMSIPREFICLSGSDDLEQEALEFLKKPDRPRAVLALWTDAVIQLARAADKLGLVLGRDLEVVGWAIEEFHASYRGRFPGGKLPPMITWRVSDLGRAVVARLAERRADPELPFMRINVATRLKAGE